MTELYDGGPPPEWLPELRLDLRPVPPTAWTGIVRRARRRQARLAALTASGTALVVVVPTMLFSQNHDSAAVPAHQPAKVYDGVCDTRYDAQAPGGSTLDHSFRLGGVVFSPPGANVPTVPATEIRRRAEARGRPLDPGMQLRYGIVRYLDGKVHRVQARWILTACGRPVSQYAPIKRGQDPRNQKPIGTAHQDVVELLTDSGATTSQFGETSFSGVCDTRLDERAPAADRVVGAFHVGEASVTAPAEGDQLAGRDRVRRNLRNAFPGTQIRLARVQPLHTPGEPRLRWVVTTCSLDGSSVRPRVPGVVNELLVYDSSGRLRQTERSGAQSEAERRITGLPPVPFPAPTYVSPGPNMCSPWSHAYPDFRRHALAAGYNDMQGCYLQADTVVIFLSAANGRGAAAVYHAVTPQEYERTYAKKFPWSSFTLLPAPSGSTVRLIKLLSPHVAEVELSGAGVATVRYKFDAATARFLPCADTTATSAPCS
jgi:hypothetical protein